VIILLEGGDDSNSRELSMKSLLVKMSVAHGTVFYSYFSKI
jgi:hypothetical protein